MGEYADLKRKKVLHFLKKLSEVGGFEISTAGNHQWIIKHSLWERPFPIPFKHNIVKKYYFEDLEKRIIKLGYTKEEFKKWLL